MYQLIFQMPIKCGYDPAMITLCNNQYKNYLVLVQAGKIKFNEERKGQP